MQALGLIETKGLLAAIESADAMLKAADVTLIEKTYVGGGLVCITVTGGVAAVKAAVEAGTAAVRQIDSALLVSDHVIPRPYEEVGALIGIAKPFKNEEVYNPNPSIAQSKQEVSTVNTVDLTVNTVDLSMDTVVESQKETIEMSATIESKEENVIVDEVTQNTDSIAEELLEKNEINSLEIDLDEIKKAVVDKIVLEYGLEKSLELLSKLKVVKLRTLARQYKSLGIAGRLISKADKQILLSEFKEYYEKNIAKPTTKQI